MIDILGWIGNIFFIYGAWAFSKRYISAWVAQIIANLCYVIQAHLMNNSSLLVISVVLIGINIYGLYEWIKKPKRKQSIENDAWHSYVVKMMENNEGY